MRLSCSGRASGVRPGWRTCVSVLPRRRCCAMRFKSSASSSSGAVTPWSMRTAGRPEARGRSAVRPSTSIVRIIRVASGRSGVGLEVASLGGKDGTRSEMLLELMTHTLWGSTGIFHTNWLGQILSPLPLSRPPTCRPQEPADSSRQTRRRVVLANGPLLTPVLTPPLQRTSGGGRASSAKLALAVASSEAVHTKAAVYEA